MSVLIKIILATFDFVPASNNLLISVIVNRLSLLIDSPAINSFYFFTSICFFDFILRDFFSRLESNCMNDLLVDYTIFIFRKVTVPLYEPREMDVPVRVQKKKIGSGKTARSVL